MGDLRDDPTLLAALRSAVKRPLTSEQRRRQKVSFIMGSLDGASTMTRAKVEQLLQQQEDETV